VTPGPFLDAIKEFNEGVREGAPDAIKYRDAVNAIADTLAEGSPFQRVADTLMNSIAPVIALQAELARAEDALKGFTGDSDAMARALGGLPKGFEDAGAAAMRSAQGIASFRQELELLGGGVPAAPVSGGGAGTAPAAFAAGGIVDRPTLFKFGRGQLGLMGEAGPEAILPLNAAGAVGAIGRDGRETAMSLARLGSGKLGVKAFAAGGVVGGVVSSLSELARGLISGVSPADAFSKALTGLSSKLIDIALNSILLGGTGGSSGLLGSLFGSLFGGVTPHAKGGVVQGMRAPAFGSAAPVRFAGGGGISGRMIASPQFTPARFAWPAQGNGEGGSAAAGLTLIQNVSYSSGITPTDRAWHEARLAQNKAETLAAVRSMLHSGRAADPNFYEAG